MQYRTKQGLQTLRHAHAFLTQRDFTVALGDLTAHVTALGHIVAQLEGHATEQAARASAGLTTTDRKRTTARALRREYLRPIAQVATRLFANDPELRTSFAKPLPRDEEGLLQVANAFAEHAEEYKARFIDRGLAPDFVERLRRVIAEYRERLIDRGLHGASRVKATAGILEEMERGRDLVRLVDMMLAPRLEDEPEIFAEWKSVSRFTRKARPNTPSVEGGAPTAVVAFPTIVRQDDQSSQAA